VAPTVAALALLDALRLSPLASWHYLTYHKDFFFDNARAKRVLGWEPRYGNREILIAAYDDYRISRRAEAAVFGTSHRKALRQGLLGWLRRLS
jgi:nucleoside-diphosphate-sugar epimerase